VVHQLSLQTNQRSLTTNMKKGEKVLISVLVGIAIVNWYLQYKASKKMDELKEAIIEK